MILPTSRDTAAESGVTSILRFSHKQTNADDLKAGWNLESGSPLHILYIPIQSALHDTTAGVVVNIKTELTNWKVKKVP